MKYNHITKLNILQTALFISFFEFFTLLLFPHLNLHFILTGLIDGFVGALLALLLFNSLKKFKVTFWLNNKKNRLEKSDLFIPSLAVGIFLAILFLSFNFIPFNFIRNEIAKAAVSGFVNTFIAMILCITIYNLLAKITSLRAKVIVNKKETKISSINILTTPFFVAIFELFILPSMGLFFILLEPLPYYISSPLVGLFGGFSGTLIASITYNIFAKRFKGIGVSLT